MEERLQEEIEFLRKIKSHLSLDNDNSKELEQVNNSIEIYEQQVADLREKLSNDENYIRVKSTFETDERPIVESLLKESFESQRQELKDSIANHEELRDEQQQRAVEYQEEISKLNVEIDDIRRILHKNEIATNRGYTRSILPADEVQNLQDELAHKLDLVQLGESTISICNDEINRHAKSIEDSDNALKILSDKEDKLSSINDYKVSNPKSDIDAYVKRLDEDRLARIEAGLDALKNRKDFLEFNSKEIDDRIAELQNELSKSKETNGIGDKSPVQPETSTIESEPTLDPIEPQPSPIEPKPTPVNPEPILEPATSDKARLEKEANEKRFELYNSALSQYEEELEDFYDLSQKFQKDEVDSETYEKKATEISRIYKNMNREYDELKVVFPDLVMVKENKELTKQNVSNQGLDRKNVEGHYFNPYKDEYDANYNPYDDEKNKVYDKNNLSKPDMPMIAGLQKVSKVTQAKNFLKKHKKAILVASGLAAVAILAQPVIIPAIMHANSVLWFQFPALQGFFHSCNLALGNVIGASYTATSGVWTSALGAAINMKAAEASILAALTTHAVSIGAVGVAARKLKNAIKEKIAKRKGKKEEQQIGEQEEFIDSKELESSSEETTMDDNELGSSGPEVESEYLSSDVNLENTKTKRAKIKETLEKTKNFVKGSFDSESLDDDIDEKSDSMIDGIDLEKLNAAIEETRTSGIYDGPGEEIGGHKK